MLSQGMILKRGKIRKVPEAATQEKSRWLKRKAGTIF